MNLTSNGRPRPGWGETTPAVLLPVSSGGVAPEGITLCSLLGDSSPADAPQALSRGSCMALPFWRLHSWGQRTGWCPGPPRRWPRARALVGSHWGLVPVCTAQHLVHLLRTLLSVEPWQNEGLRRGTAARRWPCCCTQGPGRGTGTSALSTWPKGLDLRRSFSEGPSWRQEVTSRMKRQRRG